MPKNWGKQEHNEEKNMKHKRETSGSSMNEKWNIWNEKFVKSRTDLAAAVTTELEGIARQLTNKPETESRLQTKKCVKD